MNKEKILFLIVAITFLLLSNSRLFSQTWGVGPELLISNNTGTWGNDLDIKFYPIGTVYNANKLYSPRIGGEPITGVDFLVGYSATIPKSSPHVIYGQYDGLQTSAQCEFAYGLGLYRLEFYWQGSTELLNYCYIDFRDANVLETSYPYVTDLGIYFFSPDSINFFWSMSGSNPPQNINIVNKYIKTWEYAGTPVAPLVPSKGLFKMDNANVSFLEFPINFNRFNDNIGHGDPGEIGMNLQFNYNINTHDTLISNPTTLTISPHCYLKIDTNKIFQIITPISGSNNLVVSDTARLILGAGANITVEANNKLTLKRKGEINLAQNSSIVFELGSLFCNQGGKILHSRDGSMPPGPPGNIYFEKGYTYVSCGGNTPVADYYIGDSVNFILDTNVVFSIPDSVTYRFAGAHSKLRMRNGSRIEFGKDAKIVLDSGATLVANNASFVSADTSELWEGIVLNNSGVDSIINCTFSNAKTSLSIINDANHSNTNRIIKGNTFNIPSGDLGRGIYGENNYRLLVQNNTFNMPVSSTLPSSLTFVGLYLKNSSTGGAAGEPEESEIGPYTLNIVGNVFNNGCASAILANYLSNVLPYNIHRNTFNNSSSANLIGIQISGAIKNNEFTSDDVPLGIHLVNSSPDLYNNEIEAKNVALHLAANSYPNLAPAISDGDMIWNGGSNKLHSTDIDNIQLSSAANVFTDWGNNNFSVDASGAFHIYG